MEVFTAQPDALQDVEVAFDVIEDFTRDEVLRFVDKVLREPKPGRRWVIHVPNSESPLFGILLYGDVTQELAFTRASSRAGLAVVQLCIRAQFRGYCNGAQCQDHLVVAAVEIPARLTEALPRRQNR